MDSLSTASESAYGSHITGISYRKSRLWLGLRLPRRTSWSTEAGHWNLDSILEQYRVVQHGVAIYFGSAEKLNREYLKRLRHLASRTREQTLIGLRRSQSGLITGPALDGFA